MFCEVSSKELCLNICKPNFFKRCLPAGLWCEEETDRADVHQACQECRRHERCRARQRAPARSDGHRVATGVGIAQDAVRRHCTLSRFVTYYARTARREAPHLSQEVIRPARYAMLNLSPTGALASLRFALTHLANLNKGTSMEVALDSCSKLARAALQAFQYLCLVLA